MLDTVRVAAVVDKADGVVVDVCVKLFSRGSEDATIPEDEELSITIVELLTKVVVVERVVGALLLLMLDDNPAETATLGVLSALEDTLADTTLLVRLLVLFKPNVVEMPSGATGTRAVEMADVSVNESVELRLLLGRRGVRSVNVMVFEVVLLAVDAVGMVPVVALEYVVDVIAEILVVAEVVGSVVSSDGTEERDLVIIELAVELANVLAAGSGAVMLVEKVMPPVPGWIVIGSAVVRVVVQPSLSDDSITCGTVVVYAVRIVVVMKVV